MSELAWLPGLAMRHPVQGAQQAFRAMLAALAEPGREQWLPALCCEGIEPPAAADGLPLPSGLAALLLSLLDHETTLRLHGGFDNHGVRAWLRFHTGVRLVDTPAAFELMPAAALTPDRARGLEAGSDEAPHQGATVLLPVSGFDAGPRLRLRGPGIENEQALRVAGLPAAFWPWRIAQQALFPLGVELLLCAGQRLVGLPRSTRVELLES